MGTSDEPAGEIVIDTGEEPGFCQSKEEASGGEAGEVMYQAHSHHDDPPQDHGDSEKPLGAEDLEHDIGGRLEEGVGDEEERESGIVLVG